MTLNVELLTLIIYCVCLRLYYEYNNQSYLFVLKKQSFLLFALMGKACALHFAFDEGTIEPGARQWSADRLRRGLWVTHVCDVTARTLRG